MDVASQWREGILYPRWAEWANWGFGEPRFVFYPPASWILGAALGSVLPWRAAPGAFVWLVLIAAGISMFRLAREPLPARQAVIGAVLFAVNPYSLVVAYYRSDFAELLAVAFFPLLILGAERVVREGWRHVPLLAVVFASIWLSNAPAAVIATYSVPIMLVAGCGVRRSVRPFIAGAAAMAGGFGLAAFYILPAAYERRWVQIEQVVSANLGPARNFLFTRSNDAEFMAFNWKVSSVAAGLFVVTAIAAFFAMKRRRDFPELWRILVALGVVSLALMLPLSALFWRWLPELRFVQFPWRWLDVLGVVFAFFVAAAMNGGKKRRAAWVPVIVILLAMAATATAIVKDAWWDIEDVPTTMDAIKSHHGYEGTDEYVPNGGDRYALPGNPDDEERPPGISPLPAPDIERYDAATDGVASLGGVRLHMQGRTAEHWFFTADTPSSVTLALRLLNYPAWEIRVDGREVQPGRRMETGQILVPLAAGDHSIEIRFRRTWDRTLGLVISLMFALILVGFSLSRRSPRGIKPFVAIG